MHLRTTTCALFLALAAPAFSTSAAAQNIPSGFVLDTIVSSGLAAPNDFCFLPDGRILIANRPGSVTVLANGVTASVANVPSVQTGSERALLSICPDPMFPTNGYIYVWYSRNGSSFMHLDRYTCTGDLNNPSSTNLTFAANTRTSIIANAPDNAFNHNGGTVRFGPDGMLYLSIGDDANSCSAQTINDMRGVLLRMDVSGLPATPSTTPPTATQLDPGDNPLSSNTDFSQLVIAHGLRNPFRGTIDPVTGNVYLGDVGQNAEEEVSEYIYTQGNLQLVNFGWPWREGNRAFRTCGGSQPAGLVAPIVGIPQSQGWFSVVGGPRYRPTGGIHDFDSAYTGDVFYSDYFAGRLRRLKNTAGNWATAPSVPGQPSTTDWGTGFASVTSIQVGPDGGIYVLQHPANYATTGGFLRLIRPLGPVNDIAIVSGDDQIVAANEPYPDTLVVRVDDPMGNPLANASVNFAAAGPGTLTSTNPVITDANGLARTGVAATNGGGTVRVTATTAGGNPSGVVFDLFSRKLTVTGASTLVVTQITNRTDATPPSIPYAIMVSAPGIAPLASPIGTVCTDPNNALTFILEDNLGLFGFQSLSGTGAVGTPNLTKIYQIVPPGVLNGIQLNFQAVGLDFVRGPFLTNCEFVTL